MAAVAKVATDDGVYDRVRAFRASNSRHAKTGLHKRRLEFGKLMFITTAAIVERAGAPEPFDVPEAPPLCQAAVDDWQQAAAAVEEHRESIRQRRQATAGATLNRGTLEFIRDVATMGDRYRLLFGGGLSRRVRLPGAGARLTCRGGT